MLFRSTAGVESERCDGAGVRAHLRNLAAVLEDLDCASSGRNHCARAPPGSSGDRATGLEHLDDLLLRCGEDACNTVGAAKERKIARLVNRNSAASGVERFGRGDDVECGNVLASSPALWNWSLSARREEAELC